MKTKGLGKDNVKVVTLGCAKNLVDSEVMVSQLRVNGIDTHHEENGDANIVIVNTCGFIENAKEESIDTILSYANSKKSGEIDKLYVTGCLSQRYRDELQVEIPEVDAWFGTLELPLLLKKFKADYKYELLGERVISTLNHYAYLKISEGCDRPCSFCAIPLMRGKHVSRSIEDLVDEAKYLAGGGTKELLLIAQDLTYYGIDIYGKRRLAKLLQSLSDVEGIEWIRLHYVFPSGFPLDVLDVMAERKNICKYLDMPLQHASDNMLRRMRRGITKEKTFRLIKNIRSKIPDIALRTTLLLGHPGEEEEDFREVLDFVEEFEFDRLGVFTYSHEEGTHAFGMTDNISEAVKQERANAVMEKQENISWEKNQSKVGRVLKVLIDRKEGSNFIGRTEFDSPEVDNEVLIDAKQGHLRLGDFAHVKITDAAPFDLYGIPFKPL